jgi:hypothetical protein
VSVPRTVSKVLANHVSLKVKAIDRVYLNVYVPQLKRDTGVVGFFATTADTSSFPVP